MVEQNKREYQQTLKRIAYNNKWPELSLWFDDLQSSVQNRLDAMGIHQILVPVILDDNAGDVLFRQAKLNKLISTILDSYDHLPFHPDTAFDCSWRSMEIMCRLLFNLLSELNPNCNYKGKNIPELLTIFTDSVACSLANRKESLKNAIERMIGIDSSHSSLRYLAARMFFLPELEINMKERKCNERCQEALSNSLYTDLQNKYVSDGTISAENQHKLSLLLKKILSGQEIVLADGKHRYLLELKNRLDLVLNGILFTSRCERFHGDYFSPFKSERSTLANCYQYYWQMLVSYVCFWLIVYRYCEKVDEEPIFHLDSLTNCINSTLDNMKGVLA